MTVLLIPPGWDEVRNPDNPPASYVISGIWPNARLETDAPPTAHLGQAIARRLDTLMRERSLSARAVAALAGTSHPTIGRILDGTGLADVRTIWLLEVALQAPLWPADLHTAFTLELTPGQDDGHPGPR
ncbi:helix-turn-helix domain-containing protein [Streptomyces niveus]